MTDVEKPYVLEYRINTKGRWRFLQRVKTELGARQNGKHHAWVREDWVRLKGPDGNVLYTWDNHGKVVWSKSPASIVAPKQRPTQKAHARKTPTRAITLTGMNTPPDSITLCYLEVVVMPNGEILCYGRTVGWLDSLGPFIREIGKS